MKNEQDITLFQAMSLLIDRSLIWSGDFENLRPALCRMFLNELQKTEQNPDVINVARRLVDNRG